MNHFMYPSQNVEMAGLALLGGPVDQVQYLYSIADGSVAKQLNERRIEIAKQKSEIDKRKIDVNGMSDGDAKNTAAALISQADKLYSENLQQLNKAISDHNEIVVAIKKYSFNLVNPPTVTGLSALPLLPVAAVVGSVGFLILALSIAVPAILNKSTQTKGILEQVSELVRSGGGVVQDIGSTVSKTVWAVAGLIGVYVGFQLVQDWRLRAKAA